MTTDDLVTRLLVNSAGETDLNAEAAARIRDDAATIKALKAALSKEARRLERKATYLISARRAEVAEARVAEMRAENERVQEATAMLTALALPVVATLVVDRTGATARAISGVENGEDEHSTLVRHRDVTAALEPIRAMLASTVESNAKSNAPGYRSSIAQIFLHARSNTGESDGQ